MEVIPLGSTCSIAYQLRSLGLRNYAYPFDWVRINNLSLVTKLIETNFEDFLDQNEFKLNKISKEFDVNGNMLSYIYENKFCKFYHDFEADITEDTFNDFSKKYKRRIDRLINIIKTSEKLLFVREEIGNLSQNKINKFMNVIRKINPNLNFSLKIIVNNRKYVAFSSGNVEIIYSDKKVNNWRRPEIDWNNIFS